jgi:hypothetical protein
LFYACRIFLEHATEVQKEAAAAPEVEENIVETSDNVQG